MPKSHAEMVRDSISRRRKRAREAGFCCICCKQRPNHGRVVCVSCNTANVERKRRRRRAKREWNELQRIVEFHERAGDIARKHHLYTDAVHRFQDALNVQTIVSDDWQRISEKLADTILLSNNPSQATSLHNTLLTSHLTHLDSAEEASHALFQTALHLWVTSKTEAALPIIEHAIRFAKLQGNEQFLIRANIIMATFLNLLARYEEAEKFLNAAAAIADKGAFAVPGSYWGQRGFVAVAFGREKDAFENFDRITHSANQDVDAYNIPFAWSNYAFAAMRLGRMELAKTCYERALLLARQHNIVWVIPRICLEYAWLLMRMGQQSLAHEYLTDALSYDATAPILDETFAAVGIPLALSMNDEITLEKCMRPNAIELAFMSGEPVRIGLISAAFARFYTERGHQRKARLLLHRAVRAMCNVVHAWDLPLEIARCGAMTDIPSARHLLTARAKYPCADVVQAYLPLFDAFVERRCGRVDNAYVYTRDAMARFKALRWDAYVDLARSLLPTGQHFSSIAMHHAKPFSNMGTQLTEREREVAELILKGLTNRAIAGELSISPHTVDSHVNAIMNRLGIRSRHQLADAFIQLSEVHEPIP